jgi:23S rRNA (guanosine2251-2'-O)-methyltransferase
VSTRKGKKPVKNTCIIWGKQSVNEAVLAHVPIRQIVLYQGLDQKDRLLSSFSSVKAPIREVDRNTLENFAGCEKPGGVAAEVVMPKPLDLSTVLRRLEGRNVPPTFVVLDQVEDPRNVGAIFRVADSAGVDSVLMSRRRAAPMSGVTARASAGAVFHVPLVLVPNIAGALDLLRKAGIWTMGTAADGEQSYSALDMTLPLAIVMGSEGKGMRPLVQKKCDFIAHIPMRGKVASLNVAQSSAIMLQEVVRQRDLQKR